MGHVISLSEHRARRLVARLVELQTKIDGAARSLLSGLPCEVELDRLLGDMERTLVELEAASRDVHNLDMRVAITNAVAAHSRWSAARIGTDEERIAAALYLETVRELEERYASRRRRHV